MKTSSNDEIIEIVKTCPDCRETAVNFVVPELFPTWKFHCPGCGFDENLDFLG